MNSDLSWDEFRLIKAISDAHSLVGAAERLGVNHSTVFRRLAAIESTIGARLFERSRSGYQPTAAGEEMIALATSMADSIVEFERRVAGRDVKPTGELRVTAVDGMAVLFAPALLARFRALNPGVFLELILASQNLNLSRRDADVAIRATNDPPETLVGRRICTIRWAVYAGRELAEAHGSKLVDCAPWVGFGENFGPQRGRRWIETHVGAARQIFRANSVITIAEIAAQGTSAAILPCYIGDRRPELLRIGEPQPDLEVDLWVLTHADLRYSSRVRAFTDFACAELSKMKRHFEGHGAQEPALV